MPQPLLIVVPSEIRAAKSKENLKDSLLSTLDNVNKELPNYTLVGTIMIANTPFTPDNVEGKAL